MRNRDVVVIDYGMGNLLSVKRAFQYCGANVIVSRDPAVIQKASHVVLPGVGAFPSAMNALYSFDLLDTITTITKNGTNFLGICLGMQLLLTESEEFGLSAGLNLIPGRVTPIPSQTITGNFQKIPHIGWSALHKNKENAWSETILQDIQEGMSVYFVHSFRVEVVDSHLSIAQYEYGGHSISAVIKKDNVTGCQFHPEKSGKVGLKMIQDFLLI